MMTELASDEKQVIYWEWPKIRSNCRNHLSCLHLGWPLKHRIWSSVSPGASSVSQQRQEGPHREAALPPSSEQAVSQSSTAVQREWSPREEARLPLNIETPLLSAE